MNPIILLVEDEEDDAFLMQRAFSRSSVPADVRLAPDGREALRYLRGEGKYADRDQHPVPCLTLLDLNLPYVHGLEVLRQIREEPPLRKMVIVVLTSSSADSDIEQAYELGANSYLTKANGLEGFQEIADAIAEYWLRRNRMASSLLTECIA